MIKTTFSVILALVVSHYLGLYLFDTNIPHGPDSNDIKKDIYHDKDIGCYKMKPVAYICPFHS